MGWNPEIKLIEGEHHKNFLREAYQYAWDFSEDNVTKTGAIIINSKLDKIIVYGANHYPAGLNPTKEQKADKKYKYEHIIHAEVAAINSAAKNGKATLDSIMYMPWVPCVPCARTIIDSGITKMIGHKEMIIKTPERWWEDIGRALDLLKKGKVELYMYSGKIDNVKSLFDSTEWYP